MLKHPCVYIIANQPRGTLYVGVTSNLIQRIWQHKNHVVKGFSNEHGLVNLVYYELHGDMYEAITREKNIKNWKRIWKIELIEKFNPEWVDLFSQII
jgi:putative endonuclease